MNLSFDSLFPEEKYNYGKKLQVPKAQAGLPIVPMTGLYDAMNNQLTGFQQHYDENTLTPGKDSPQGNEEDKELKPYTAYNYQTPEQQQGPIDTTKALPQQEQKKQAFHGGFNGPAISEAILGGIGIAASVLPDKTKKYNAVKPKNTYNPYAQGTGSQAIMDNGGVLGGGPNPLGPQMGLLGNIATGIKDFFTPDPVAKTKSKPKQEASPVPLTPYDPMMDEASAIRKMADTYSRQQTRYYDETTPRNTYTDKDIENRIKLKTGKYKGVSVPTRIIDDATAAAKRAGIDPYEMLGLIGQESTFGVAKGRNQTDKSAILSGWTLGEQYAPYDYLRYLADNKVKGAVAKKTPHGFDYSESDFTELNKQLSSNPKLMEGYYQKLSQRQNGAEFDPYYEAAMRIKKKGLKSYNPGDPNYIKDVNNSVALVRQDPELQKYLSTRK